MRAQFGSKLLVMDESESIAGKHLASLGFEQIVYQPDGNVSPDFVVDGRIAVEVRRLNENEVAESGKLVGLETLPIATTRRLQRLFRELGPAPSGTSWFAFFNLVRPVPRWKVVEPYLRRQLESFRDNECLQKLGVMKIAKGFEIEIIHKASNPHSTCFVLGGGSDRDTGGFVFSDTQWNLRLCVEEKMRKISSVRHKYAEWWLIFVDRIGFGVADCDRELYHQHLDIDHDLDRVLLLSPDDPTRVFEVPKKRAAVV